MIIGSIINVGVPKKNSGTPTFFYKKTEHGVEISSKMKLRVPF